MGVCLIFFIVVFFLSVRFLRQQRRNGNPRDDIPPGPLPWPILGNLLNLRKNPHIWLSQMAEIYGPILSIKLGLNLVVVASSPSSAKEILKTQDKILSARYVPHTFRVETFNLSLPFAEECHERWNKLRTLCKMELFGAKPLEQQSSLRERKVAEMINFISTKQGEIIDIGEITFKLVFNIMSNMMISRDVLDLEDENRDEGFKSHISRVMELGFAPNLADFYPVFGKFDVQGLKAKSKVFVDKIHSFWDKFIKERREIEFEDESDRRHDFMKAMISAGFEDLEIKSLMLDLFTAGTDTVSTTFEWAMSELMRNPNTMKKVKEELNDVIQEVQVKETHLSSLHYLQACIKETFRLHPAVPFLLPRKATEDCKIQNYRIPKDSRIIVNLWDIGRNPKIWSDPYRFFPERFMEANIDYKGNDFQLIPFGAGRRICPGLPLASRLLPLILASLIHNFDWFLPNGEDPCDLNMEERFGLTLAREKPLLLIPKYKLEKKCL